MSDDPLKQILDFDEADLAANRNGVLTERQRQRLTKTTQSWKRIGIGGGVAFLVAGIAPCVIVPLLLPVIYDPKQLDKLFFAVAPMFCLFIVMSALAIGFISIFVRYKGPGLAMAQVEGPVAIVKVEYRSGRGSGTRQTRTEITVSGQRFVTKSEVGGTLTPGEVWAIYYLKDNSEIMSLERVRGGK